MATIKRLPIESKSGENIKLVRAEDIQPLGEDNGRYSEHSPESIEELAGLIKTNINGQMHPVGITTRAGKVYLVYGERRRLAVMKLNEGLEPNDENYTMLKAVYIPGNETDHYLANLIENLGHKALNAMDIAYNVHRMKTKLHKKTSEVATFFGKSLAWVKQHESLMNLIDGWRKKVANGECSMTDGIKIAAMSNEDQRNALAEVDGFVAEAIGQEEDALLESPANSDPIAETETEIQSIERANRKKAKENKKKAKERAVVRAVISKPSAKEKQDKPLEAIGKRSWRDFEELMYTIGPACSRRLQAFADIMMKCARGGETRDDKVLLEILEVFLNNTSIESKEQAEKAVAKSMSASNGI